MSSSYYQAKKPGAALDHHNAVVSTAMERYREHDAKHRLDTGLHHHQRPQDKPYGAPYADPRDSNVDLHSSVTVSQPGHGNNGASSTPTSSSLGGNRNASHGGPMAAAAAATSSSYDLATGGSGSSSSYLANGGRAGGLATATTSSSSAALSAAGAAGRSSGARAVDSTPPDQHLHAMPASGGVSLNAFSDTRTSAVGGFTMTENQRYPTATATGSSAAAGAYDLQRIGDVYGSNGASGGNGRTVIGHTVGGPYAQQGSTGGASSATSYPAATAAAPQHDDFSRDENPYIVRVRSSAPPSPGQSGHSAQPSISRKRSYEENDDERDDRSGATMPPRVRERERMSDMAYAEFLRGESDEPPRLAMRGENASHEQRREVNLPHSLRTASGRLRSPEYNDGEEDEDDHSSGHLDHMSGRPLPASLRYVANANADATTAAHSSEIARRNAERRLGSGNASGDAFDGSAATRPMPASLSSNPSSYRENTGMVRDTLPSSYDRQSGVGGASQSSLSQPEGSTAALEIDRHRAERAQRAYERSAEVERQFVQLQNAVFGGDRQTSTTTPRGSGGGAGDDGSGSASASATAGVPQSLLYGPSSSDINGGNRAATSGEGGGPNETRGRGGIAATFRENTSTTPRGSDADFPRRSSESKTTAGTVVGRSQSGISGLMAAVKAEGREPRERSNDYDEDEQMSRTESVRYSHQLATAQFAVESANAARMGSGQLSAPGRGTYGAGLANDTSGAASANGGGGRVSSGEFHAPSVSIPGGRIATERHPNKTPPPVPLHRPKSPLLTRDAAAAMGPTLTSATVLTPRTSAAGGSLASLSSPSRSGAQGTAQGTTQGGQLYQGSQASPASQASRGQYGGQGQGGSGHDTVTGRPSETLRSEFDRHSPFDRRPASSSMSPPTVDATPPPSGAMLQMSTLASKNAASSSGTVYDARDDRGDQGGVGQYRDPPSSGLVAPPPLPSARSLSGQTSASNSSMALGNARASVGTSRGPGGGASPRNANVTLHTSTSMPAPSPLRGRDPQPMGSSPGRDINGGVGSRGGVGAGHDRGFHDRPNSFRSDVTVSGQRVHRAASASAGTGSRGLGPLTSASTSSQPLSPSTNASNGGGALAGGQHEKLSGGGTLYHHSYGHDRRAIGGGVGRHPHDDSTQHGGHGNSQGAGHPQPSSEYDSSSGAPVTPRGQVISGSDAARGAREGTPSATGMSSLNSAYRHPNPNPNPNPNNQNSSQQPRSALAGLSPSTRAASAHGARATSSFGGASHGQSPSTAFDDTRHRSGAHAPAPQQESPSHASYYRDSAALQTSTGVGASSSSTAYGPGPPRQGLARSTAPAVTTMSPTGASGFQSSNPTGDDFQNRGGGRSALAGVGSPGRSTTTHSAAFGSRTPGASPSRSFNHSAIGSGVGAGGGSGGGGGGRRRAPSMCKEPGRPFLPPRAHGDDRLCIVLDLDETLLYARDGPVKPRPYASQLLCGLKDLGCEVVVWTAGERAYAQSAIRTIDHHDAVEHCVYRHPRWFSGKAHYFKDLGTLGRDVSRTLLVDNTPDCLGGNPGSGLLVTDFYGDKSQHTDRSLSTILAIVRRLVSSPAESVEQGMARAPEVSRRYVALDGGGREMLFTLKGDVHPTGEERPIGSVSSTPQRGATSSGGLSYGGGGGYAGTPSRRPSMPDHLGPGLGLGNGCGPPRQVVHSPGQGRGTFRNVYGM